MSAKQKEQVDFCMAGPIHQALQVGNESVNENFFWIHKSLEEASTTLQAGDRL